MCVLVHNRLQLLRRHTIGIVQNTPTSRGIAPFDTKVQGLGLIVKSSFFLETVCLRATAFALPSVAQAREAPSPYPSACQLIGVTSSACPTTNKHPYARQKVPSVARLAPSLHALLLVGGPTMRPPKQRILVRPEHDVSP